MANRFSDFLESNTSKEKILKTSQPTSKPPKALEVEKKKSRKVENSTLKSQKISAEAFEKLVILKHATGRKQIDLLEEAIDNLFAKLSLENQKVRALQVIYQDEITVDNRQTSIDDFL